MPTSYRLSGLVITDHEFTLPLDHADSSGETIQIFAREVALPEGQNRPFLVYFQGGPGKESPRPSKTGWMGRALQEYRVLLLDQRGTGRSSPVGTLETLSPQAQVEYLRHFRADAIVRDAEAIRQQLGVDRWSVLGQSFGGFCVMTYLSFFPEGLREAFITGGLAPLGRPTEQVYQATYARLLEKNLQFYRRFPQDRERVLALHRQLAQEDVRLPSGDQLTSRRFRQLGLMLGASDGFERLHFILDFPLHSPAFLHEVEAAHPFARNPLYAVLHEACYADGVVSGWAAERVMPAAFEAPELFTGEMVYPWMFSEYSGLRPLAEAAEQLACESWPALYDLAQLSRNEVPVAAAVYAEDMYVERTYAEETARSIRGLRMWLTNEYEHNGLRADGERVLGRLIDLLRNDA